MIYIIKTISGKEIEIDQQQRDKIAEALLSTKAERAGFVEIGEGGPIIATSAIATITRKDSW